MTLKGKKTGYRYINYFLFIELSDKKKEKGVIKILSYYFTPIKSHPDFGFGMMASTFVDAANKLDTNDNFALGFEYLPICYLKRHSLELFLKSFIVLLHKNYHINYGTLDYSSDTPKYKNQQNEWKFLFKEHDLLKLFIYFQSIVQNHLLDIKQKTLITDFHLLDQEYLNKIEKINNYDSHSDYFRYPMSKDNAKDKKKSL